MSEYVWRCFVCMRDGLKSEAALREHQRVAHQMEDQDEISRRDQEASDKAKAKAKAISQDCRRDARLAKLKSLASHAFYGKDLKRMAESDFDKIVEFIEDSAHLDRDAYTMAVQRYGLDSPIKLKGLGVLLDVLLACREER